MNDLGRRCAGSRELTLAAYQRGHIISWVPGAEMDVWMPCATVVEDADGKSVPHVVYIRAITDLGIYCPACRAERNR